MACLKNNAVRQDCEGESKFEAHKAIEQANHLACNMLTQKGLNGKLMWVDLKKGKLKTGGVVTAPNTIERQMQLAQASTHGERFF